MKQLIRTATLLLVLCGSALAVENPDAEHSVLREKLNFIEAALNDKAFERILPLLDENVVIIFLNGEVARGVDQVRAYFEKTLGSSNPILSDYHTKAEVGAPARFAGDIALADGSTQDTFVFANGSDMVVHSKWTVTLQKQGNDWKILQLHFSSNIFDNPLVNSARNNLVMFTVAAAVGGLIIGLLIGRRRKRNA